MDPRIRRIPQASRRDGFGDPSHLKADPARWIREFIREIGCESGHPSHLRGRWIRGSIAPPPAGQNGSFGRLIASDGDYLHVTKSADGATEEAT
jgi:hypothetical protein